MDKASRILVTGGAGFIGSALVRSLISESRHEILVADALTYAADGRSLASVVTHPRFRFVRADIGDRAAMAALFARFAPGIVVHLAAETHVDRSIDGPAGFVQTNVVGTLTLLDVAAEHWRSLDPAAREAFRFHHVSTDEVFGSLDGEGRFDEGSPYDPRSPYSASKAGADHLVRAWGHTYGLPTIISYCSNNYGPYQFPEKLIPLMIVKCLTGEPLPVYGDGGHVRDWLHVDDHVRALRAVFERGRPGERYAIGGDAERTNREVDTTICAALDDLRPRADGRPHACAIARVADRRGHDRRYAIDARRMRDELGWRPRETFASGIERTIRWYLDNEDWWRGVGGHAGERLGLRA